MWRWVQIGWFLTTMKNRSKIMPTPWVYHVVLGGDIFQKHQFENARIFQGCKYIRAKHTKCMIQWFFVLYTYIYIFTFPLLLVIYIYDIYHNFPIMITISPMITANPRVFQPIGESPPRDRTSRSQRLNFRTISWLAGVANISSLGEAEALLRPWYGWIYWMRSRLRRTFLRGQEAVLEKISPL